MRRRDFITRYFRGFSQGMRELGYVEGRDYGFEVRYADGNLSRIPAQMEELVRLKPRSVPVLLPPI